MRWVAIKKVLGNTFLFHCLLINVIDHDCIQRGPGFPNSKYNYMLWCVVYRIILKLLHIFMYCESKA